VRGTLGRIAAVAVAGHLISGRIPVSPGRQGRARTRSGRAPPVPAAARLSRAPRWPHRPPGRDASWPPGSAIRKLRKIGPLRNIRATPVARSFRGSRMFRANGGGGTGVWGGTASACPDAPAAPGRRRPPGQRDTIYGTRSGWPHRHRPRPFSLSKHHLYVRIGAEISSASASISGVVAGRGRRNRD
jgi:hypothetical protein